MMEKGRSTRWCRSNAAPALPALSFWAGETNINARSIGIELVNPGHEYGYRAFAEPQIVALIELSHGILARHVHSLQPGAGAIAMSRRNARKIPVNCSVAAAGAGRHRLCRRRRDSGPTADALVRFGYDPNAPQDKVITAFQRHFRPQRLTGMWDTECAGTLASPADKVASSNR